VFIIGRLDSKKPYGTFASAYRANLVPVQKQMKKALIR